MLGHAVRLVIEQDLEKYRVTLERVYRLIKGINFMNKTRLRKNIINRTYYILNERTVECKILFSICGGYCIEYKDPLSNNKVKDLVREELVIKR